MPTTDTSIDTATEQLTVTLPRDVVEILRAKVASGNYASEGEFVSELIRNDVDSMSDQGWGPSDDWITKHAVPVLEKMEADPSRGTPIEQVQQELQRRRDARHKQAA